MIEMLVSIAIVGVLAAIVVSGFGRVTESAKVTKCASNLRQIGQGIALYMGDNDGKLPTTDSVAGVGSTNWQERIAPYLVGSKGVVNNQRFILRTYLGCPSDKGNGVTYGINKYLTPESRAGAYTRLVNVKTKLSDTLLVGENYTADLWNINPGTGKSADNVDYTRHKTGSKKAVANFLFADFHVETLSYQDAVARPVIMDPQTL